MGYQESDCRVPRLLTFFFSVTAGCRQIGAEWWRKEVAERRRWRSRESKGWQTGSDDQGGMLFP